MRRSERRLTKATALVAAIFLVNCDPGLPVVGPANPSASTPRISMPGLIVSEPGRASGATITAADAGVAYVSLPPGSLPGILRVKISNPRVATLDSIPVVNGGFDPVAIQAGAGDSLVITAYDPTGPKSTSEAVVPVRRPPAVVRTNPPKGRTDVALNARVAVIFSEPVDFNTVNTTTISLLRDGSPVAGTVEKGDAIGLTAEFVAASSLATSTDYTLVVTTGIKDLEGDALQDALSVTFTTTETLTGRIAFASTRDGTAHIYLANADGSGLTRLTSTTGADRNPAWSPDGSQIAFTRATSDTTSSIHTMRADGTELRELTDGSTIDSDPTWSPDGKKIFFTRRIIGFFGAIYSMNAGGGTATRVFGEGMQPDVSPDGSRIVFSHLTDDPGGPFDQAYIMNVEGTGLVRLTGAQNDTGECSPAWSPDGSTIAFWNYEYGIAVTGTGGGGVPRSVFGGGIFDARSKLVWCNAKPTWSPDGRKIVFVYEGPGPDGHHTLYVVDVATGNARQLFANSIAGEDFDPAWSR